MTNAAQNSFVQFYFDLKKIKQVFRAPLNYSVQSSRDGSEKKYACILTSLKQYKKLECKLPFIFSLFVCLFVF